MYLPTSDIFIEDSDGFPTKQLCCTIYPASRESVEHVLSQDDNSEDGRSQWLWIRLQNGDLILGVFPQGDTYFDVEHDA